MKKNQKDLILKLSEEVLDLQQRQEAYMKPADWVPYFRQLCLLLASPPPKGNNE